MLDIQSSGRAMRGAKFVGRVLPLVRLIPSEPSKTELVLECITLVRTYLREILHGNLEAEEESSATLRALKQELGVGSQHVKHLSFIF